MPKSTKTTVRPFPAHGHGPIGWLRNINRRARLSVWAPVSVEALEDRQLLSTVYVSSSAGRDNNSGSSASSPVRSIAKAKSLIHRGDTLLLKSGDSWNESLGRWITPNTKIDSYGQGARPRINTTGDGIDIDRAGADNITVRRISFNGGGHSDNFGIYVSGSFGNITIDNCEVRAFRTNISAIGWSGYVHDLTIRNSVITDANGVDKSQGIFADRVRNLTLDGNVVDGNGGKGSMYNHGAYITALCSNLVARKNIFSNSSNFGMQARCGGVITNNLFMNNSVGLSVGMVNGAGVQTDGGVVATVTGNVFTGKGSGRMRGVGIEMGNIKSGLVSDNLFTKGTGRASDPAISLGWGTAKGRQVGINNLRITNNSAVQWGGWGVYIADGLGKNGRPLRNLVVTNNNFPGNDHKVSNLTATTRTVQGYDANFIRKARAQAGPLYTATAIVNFLMWK